MITTPKFWGMLAISAMICAACSQSREGAEHVDIEDALLELPVETLEEREVRASPSAAFEPDAPLELTTQTLALAIGEEYSDTLFVSPSVTLWCGAVTSALTIDEVTSRGRSVEILQGGSDTIRLRAISQGLTTASVTGTLDLEGGNNCPSQNESLDEVRFEMRLDVQATKVAGARLVSCDGSQHIAMELGAKIDALVLPTDDQGRVFSPSNAVDGRAVSIRVIGDVDSLEIQEGDDERTTIADVYLPPTESSLYLHTPFSEPIRIDAVSPRQVTEPNVSFITVWEGEERFTDLILADGETYDEGDFEGSGDRIFPIVQVPSMVGQTTYCSPLDPELFEFETSTPDVCERESLDFTEYVGFKSIGFWQYYVGHAAHLKADGTCSMKLSAESLAGGAGWSQTLEATFTGTETLQEMVFDAL